MHTHAEDATRGVTGLGVRDCGIWIMNSECKGGEGGQQGGDGEKGAPEEIG